MKVLLLPYVVPDVRLTQSGHIGGTMGFALKPWHLLGRGLGALVRDVPLAVLVFPVSWLEGASPR